MCSKREKTNTLESKKLQENAVCYRCILERENPKTQIPHIENSLYIYIVYISIDDTHIAVVKIPTLDILRHFHTNGIEGKLCRRRLSLLVQKDTFTRQRKSINKTDNMKWNILFGNKAADLVISWKNKESVGQFSSGCSADLEHMK